MRVPLNKHLEWFFFTYRIDSKDTYDVGSRWFSFHVAYTINECILLYIYADGTYDTVPTSVAFRHHLKRGNHEDSVHSGREMNNWPKGGDSGRRWQITRQTLRGAWGYRLRRSTCTCYLLIDDSESLTRKKSYALFNNIRGYFWFLLRSIGSYLPIKLHRCNGNKRF